MRPANLSLVYGQHLPPFKRTANFVNGDSAASLAAQPKCTTTVPLDKTGAIAGPAGNYKITCSGASAKNYVIAYVTGTLKVTLARPRITYAGPTTIRRGKKAKLSAYQFVTPLSPVIGRKMVFTLGIDGTVQRCTTGATNSNGLGACSITAVKQPKGKALVAAHFIRYVPLWCFFLGRLWS